MNYTKDKQNIGWGIFLIAAGLSIMIELYTNLDDWIKISVFFLGGLAGLYVYFKNKSEWTLLISPYIMLSISLIGWLAIFGLFSGDFLGSIVLSLVAAPFVFVYQHNKENWWALIPTYILLSIALMLLLTSFNILSGIMVAPFILYSISIPFLVIYFKNKEYWWSLIPAYTMITVGTMVGLIEFGILVDMLIPAYIMAAISIPFFIVYYLNKEHWWALIPAGILGFLSLAFMLSAPVGKIAIPVVLIIAGAYMLFRKKE